MQNLELKMETIKTPPKQWWKTKDCSPIKLTYLVFLCLIWEVDSLEIYVTQTLKKDVEQKKTHKTTFLFFLLSFSFSFLYFINAKTFSATAFVGLFFIFFFFILSQHIQEMKKKENLCKDYSVNSTGAGFSFNEHNWKT